MKDHPRRIKLSDEMKDGLFLLLVVVVLKLVEYLWEDSLPMEWWH